MREFGILLGCAEMGVMPESFHVVEGIADAMSGEKSASAGRLIVKAARDVMVATGRGYSAPAFHLYFILKSADWNTHCQEVTNHIVRTLKVLEPMHKQALTIPDALGAAGLAGRGALYSSLGLGGGLGTLYWLLNRHANQDDADVESMKHQIHYYHQLSNELDDSLRRKYHYEHPDQNAVQPR
jgi:hypothetical protein